MSREILKNILEFLSKTFRTIRLIDSYILIGLLSVVQWFCDFFPVNLPINTAGFLGQNLFCITGSGSLLPLSPVLTPSFIMLASILGDIQVLRGSCAGSYSTGRGAALWQRALLHLRVLCVIPSGGSLLYSSLLVQVSHSFLPSRHLLGQLQYWHMDTLNLHRFCRDFKQNNSTARSLPSFPLVKKTCLA